jgi:hypothetical protein
VTRKSTELLKFQEELLVRIIAYIEQAGVQFATPSQTYRE